MLSDQSPRRRRCRRDSVAVIRARGRTRCALFQAYMPRGGLESCLNSVCAKARRPSCRQARPVRGERLGRNIISDGVAQPFRGSLNSCSCWKTETSFWAGSVRRSFPFGADGQGNEPKKETLLRVKSRGIGSGCRSGKVLERAKKRKEEKVALFVFRKTWLTRSRYR